VLRPRKREKISTREIEICCVEKMRARDVVEERVVRSFGKRAHLHVVLDFVFARRHYYRDDDDDGVFVSVLEK